MEGLDGKFMEVYVNRGDITTNHQKEKGCGKSDKINEDYSTQTITRSSCPQMSYKIGVIKSIAKFTGKHLYRVLVLNKSED